MPKISNKTSIARLVHICAAKGLSEVIISPGSRNAALTISFAEDDRFNCINIPDERVAAFYALGVGQATGRAAIICCTSGSAALNYAPAIAEAYHQKIPMLILTADRPIEWIDQRAGQTMRQRDVYHNYIKKSFEIIEEAQQPEHLWYNDRIVNEAINLTTRQGYGPVHINVPMREPLYQLVDAEEVAAPKIIHHAEAVSLLSERDRDRLLKQWASAKRVLVIVGQGCPDTELSEAVDRLAGDGRVVVLTETTSNVQSALVLSSIDRVIEGISQDRYEDFAPDLLITFGAAIVSKKIRFMLRQMQISDHWQIDPYEGYVDTYQHLTERICVTPTYLLELLGQHVVDERSEFKLRWEQRDAHTLQAHHDYLDMLTQDGPWCDMQVIKTVLEEAPAGVMHASSSTPIRYIQLFAQRDDLIYCCNRGLSGIDGCTSTAMGYAAMVEDHVTLITGDLSFFYDSNALWHHHIPANLTIVLINNGGGNIFRYVKGPDRTNHLEQHFEAAHETKAEYVARAHDIAYHSADSLHSLKEALYKVYDTAQSQCSIVEVFTPREENIPVLQRYFEYLRKV